MIRKNSFVIFMLIVSVSVSVLSGCSGFRRSLGFEKNPPDEFKVVRRAPLTLPPGFSLKPPKKKDPSKEREALSLSAHSLMTGEDILDDEDLVYNPEKKKKQKKTLSDKELHPLVSKAHKKLPNNSNTEKIRETIDDEAGVYTDPDSASLADKVLNFLNKDNSKGDTIDPKQEEEIYKSSLKKDDMGHDSK